MKIVLASKSPRRKEIIESLGYDILIDPSNVDESLVKEKNIKKLVMGIAKLKAETVSKKHDNAIIIGIDTLVYFQGRKIGQQKTDKGAKKIIKRLLGKKHEIYSGICLINTKNNKSLQDYDVSCVKLKTASEKALKDYIKTGKYEGKAGAYDIADKEFKPFISKIEGCRYNIRGFPIKKFKKMIKKIR